LYRRTSSEAPETGFAGGISVKSDLAAGVWQRRRRKTERHDRKGVPSATSSLVSTFCVCAWG